MSMRILRLLSLPSIRRKNRVGIGPVVLISIISVFDGHGQVSRAQILSLSLDSTERLELINGKAEITAYEGRRALRLLSSPEHHGTDDVVLAIVSGEDFQNGTIEVELAGSPRRGAPTDDRGFIGIAFRTQERGARREVIYIRPTNGRADDQIRRNHSTQYESIPEFPWYRLRKESPGMYESYVDLEAGAWTKMKIVVSGREARLYVNRSDQPSLLVNDLRLGETHGQVALWAYWSTDAYFSNLRIQND